MLIKGRIEGVEVFLVQLILGNAQAFAEALVVDDLALTQELDGLADIGIVDQPQDIVISSACLLFCVHRMCKLFGGKGSDAVRKKVCDNGVIIAEEFSRKLKDS